jgi:hypothetical protein
VIYSWCFGKKWKVEGERLEVSGEKLDVERFGLRVGSEKFEDVVPACVLWSPGLVLKVGAGAGFVFWLMVL